VDLLILLLFYAVPVASVVAVVRHGPVRTALHATALLAMGLSPIIACSQRTRREQTIAAGDHEIMLRHDGRRRTYLVHVPPGPQSAPMAVVLAFHGGGGNASGFERYAELDRVADRERFLVVYPNGTGPLPNRLLTWNAGDGCCGYALTNRVDDTGFAVAVVADLERRVRIDRKRIYATGHSNGAILSHRLAAERGFVAAIVPVAPWTRSRAFARRTGHRSTVSAIPGALCGGLGPPFPGTDNRVQHQPVRRASTAGSRPGCSTR
jgi:poly(3-hydroxybutyrate) depolymerase